MRVISIDPGGTTGWVLHEVPDEKATLPLEVSGGQIGPDDHHAELDALLDDNDPDIVVCEDFQYRLIKHKGASMPGINLVSKEYIGVVKLWVQQYPDLHQPQLVMRLPAQAVGKQENIFWTDEKLKRLGVYTAGEPHRNDATRHLLAYLLDVAKRRDYVRLLAPLG